MGAGTAVAPSAVGLGELLSAGVGIELSGGAISSTESGSMIASRPSILEGSKPLTAGKTR